MGGETGTSEDNAVVGAAFDAPGEPDTELRGKGAMRPPLKDIREEVLPLAREPGRKGDDTLGECASAASLVGEGGAIGGSFEDGEGVLLRAGGVGGIVSSGLSTGACAKSLEREEGPAVAELDRVRTGNRCEVGDRVAPSGSAADAPDGDGSAGGGLIGRSRDGGLEGASCPGFVDDFLRFVSTPGRVQSSTSSRKYFTPSPRPYGLLSGSF